MGVVVWPMVELEADDALASAARARGARIARVEKVCIWTPDKDLAQCVVGDRVVQVDRKSGQIRDADGVRAKFGVPPERIPDYLALVGDAADGYPGDPGHRAQDGRPAHRAVTAAIEDFSARLLRDAEREAGAALQAPRDLRRGRAALRRRRRAALARSRRRPSRPQPTGSATRGSCPESPALGNRLPAQ